MGPRKSELIRASLFFAGLGALFWAKVLVGKEALFYDTLFRIFFPYAVFIRESIRSLHFPFWNPHLYSGVPFMANMQSALFYPSTYLYALLDFSSALALNTFLHAWMAALFMYAFCRELELSKIGALVAGVTFAFNGYFVMHYAAPSNFNSYVWLPLVFLFMRRVYHGTGEGNKRNLVAATLALSLQIFAGHPQFVLYTALSLVIYTAPTAWRSFSRLLLLFALSLMITSPQLLPSFHFMGESSRMAGMGYDWATAYSLKPIELLKMLLCPLWNRYWVPSSGDPHVVSVYFGLPILVLAAMAFRRRPVRSWMPFAVIACAGALIALGRYLPLYPALYRCIPVVQWIRFPSQALYLTCFGIAVLAGMGMDRWPFKKVSGQVLLALCVVDLWGFSQKSIETIDPSFYKSRTPTIRYLQSHAGVSRIMMTPRTRAQTRRSGATELQAWLKFQDTLYPNLAMAHGLYDADGFEEMRYARYDRVLEELAKSPLSLWMDILGIRYVLSFWEMPKGKFNRVATGSAFVFENRKAFPKSYFVPKNFDSDLNALFKSVAANVPVKVLRYLSNRVSLELDAPGPGWVVLTDSYDKGWKAIVNGRRTLVHRVNEVQCAVRVEPGRSVLEFHYTPPYFASAVLLSLSTLAVLVALGGKR